MLLTNIYEISTVFDRYKSRFNTLIFWGIELECGSQLDNEMTKLACTSKSTP